MNRLADLKLLELAAKAAGLRLCSEWDAATDGILIGVGNGDLQVWNPLTDDGDALRLAVKLQIHATYFPRLGYATAATCGLSVDEYAAEPDAVPATRRAIVRAAAAIGETL